MSIRSFKTLLVAVFSLISLSISPILSTAQVHDESNIHKKEPAEGKHETAGGEGKFNPGELIMDHIGDSHNFHFFDWNGHAVSVPLPVILYSPQRGFSAFMSSKFQHGHADYNGYRLEHTHIVAVNAQGE